MEKRREGGTEVEKDERKTIRREKEGGEGRGRCKKEKGVEKGRHGRGGGEEGNRIGGKVGRRKIGMLRKSEKEEKKEEKKKKNRLERNHDFFHNRELNISNREGIGEKSKTKLGN